MTFSSDLARFKTKVTTAVPAVAAASGDIVFREWVHGGPITGAPGQPVARSGSPNDGELRDSYTHERQSDGSSVTQTDCRYAADVEDNVHGFTFASGGPHGQKLVIAGWKNVVAAAVAEVAR